MLEIARATTIFKKFAHYSATQYFPAGLRPVSAAHSLACPQKTLTDLVRFIQAADKRQDRTVLEDCEPRMHPASG